MHSSYLNLMLLSFFDLEGEINKYVLIDNEKIVLNFIKKIILSFGLCNQKIYDQVARNIMGKKGNFNFENYLDCFSPIFDASDKYQSLKYKFLLSLVKNHFSNSISLQNYKIFCELIHGKWIYEIDICDDLTNKLLTTFKEKYPTDDCVNLNFLHTITVVEFLVDMEYGD